MQNWLIRICRFSSSQGDDDSKPCQVFSAKATKRVKCIFRSWPLAGQSVTSYNGHLRPPIHDPWLSYVISENRKTINESFAPKPVLPHVFLFGTTDAHSFSKVREPWNFVYANKKILSLVNVPASGWTARRKFCEQRASFAFNPTKSVKDCSKVKESD